MTRPRQEGDAQFRPEVAGGSGDLDLRQDAVPAAIALAISTACEVNAANVAGGSSVNKPGGLEIVPWASVVVSRRSLAIVDRGAAGRRSTVRSLGHVPNSIECETKGKTS